MPLSISPDTSSNAFDQQPETLDAAAINEYIYEHYVGAWLKKHGFFPVFIRSSQH